jgi:signal transduction histidine kinase/WD40 repeat protein
MDDETRQLREQTLNQIILGLILVGTGGSLIALVVDGLLSPWLLRSLAVFIIALIAFVAQRLGRFMVAAYVLVLEMIGLVVGMFLQPNNITGIAPFLFIPIVIIAGLIFTPTAILVVTFLAIFLTLATLLVTGQLTLLNLLYLSLPFGLTILTALLVVGNAFYRVKLSNLLSKNRDLLRWRTREMVEAQQKVETLQQRITKLQQQVLQTEAVLPQVQPKSSQEDNKFYYLIKGTIRELNRTAKRLEDVISKMADSSFSNGRAAALEETWHNVDYLANLVVNLEELAEMERDEFQLNLQEVNIARLIADVSSTAHGLVRGKNIEILEYVMDDLPTLWVDPDRIRQALLNLVNNAIQYTNEGYVDIQAEIFEQEITFSVSDTGMGVPHDDLGVVFETFGRSADVAVQQKQGAGLGLAISKKLIELHQGRIWSISTPGIGSTFYVSLPVHGTSEGVSPLTLHSKNPDPQILTPASLAITGDPETTILSQPVVPQLVPPANIGPPQKPVDSLSTKPNRKISFLPPVARFSSIYIDRFGLSLLGLFLVVGCLVLFLAILNQPTSDNSATSQLALTSSPTTSSASEGVAPTATGTAPPAPTAKTPVVVTDSSASATSPATTQPKATISSTATALPSPTLTPTPTQTPTSMIVLIDTPTFPSPTPSPFPTEPIVVQPTLPAPSRSLSFIVDSQSIILQDVSSNSSSEKPILPEMVANNRPSWSTTSGILLTTMQDGNREIYQIDPITGQSANMTEHPGDDQQPSWSPQGRYFAFSSGRDGNFNIYIKDIQTRNLTQLTNSRGFDEWPIWSPNGRNIAFVSTRDGGNQEIYMMGQDGANQRRLTNEPAADTTPVWSPDGRFLLFVSERDGNANLYLIEVDSGATHQVTNDLANEISPAWSPDGRTIAFVVQTETTADIYTFSAPAGATTIIDRARWSQITDTPARENYPVWLP